MNRKSAPKTTTRKHMKLGKRTTTKRGKRTLQRGGVVPEKLKCDIKDTFEYKGKHYCFFTKVQDVPEGNTKEAIIRTVNYAMGPNNPIYTYMVKYPKKTSLTIITLDYIQTLDGELENPPAEIKRKLASSRRLMTSTGNMHDNSGVGVTSSASNKQKSPIKNSLRHSASMSGEKSTSAKGNVKFNKYPPQRRYYHHNQQTKHGILRSDELDSTSSPNRIRSSENGYSESEEQQTTADIMQSYNLAAIDIDDNNNISMITYDEKGKELIKDLGQIISQNLLKEDKTRQFKDALKNKTLDEKASFTIFTSLKDKKTYICEYIQENDLVNCRDIYDNKNKHANLVASNAEYIPPTKIESTYDEPVHMQ